MEKETGVKQQVYFLSFSFIERHMPEDGGREGVS